jgi:hypothetical protein
MSPSLSPTPIIDLAPQEHESSVARSSGDLLQMASGFRPRVTQEGAWTASAQDVVPLSWRAHRVRRS